MSCYGWVRQVTVRYGRASTSATGGKQWQIFMNSEEGKEALQKVISKASLSLSENVSRCVEWMQRDITFGKGWQVTDLAEQLKLEPFTMQFSVAMSEVNKVLERDGYHLTTRGKSGQEYYVESLERSSAIASSMNADAVRTLRRAVVFLHGVTSKHDDKLSEAQKRKLEKQAEIVALRYVLAARIR